MPLYEHVKSKRRHRTNAGSTQDKRLSASSNYRVVGAASPSGEPARNASREAWAEYATRVARDSDEAEAIGGLSRDELVEVFAGREVLG